MCKVLGLILSGRKKKANLNLKKATLKLNKKQVKKTHVHTEKGEGRERGSKSKREHVLVFVLFYTVELKPRALDKLGHHYH